MTEQQQYRENIEKIGPEAATLLLLLGKAENYMKLGSPEAMRQESHSVPPPHKIDPKWVSIQHARIDACDTLLDYLHDDVPWKDQQPMGDMLKALHRKFEDELEEGESNE